MSMIVCSGCGARVSKKAKRCPKCGSSINEKRAPCKTCGTLLSAMDVFAVSSYQHNGTTHHSRSQTPCSNCGEPKPFDIESQLEVDGIGGHVFGFFMVLLLVGVIGLIFSVPY